MASDSFHVKIDNRYDFQNVRYAYQCVFCVSDVCRIISPGNYLRYCESKERVLKTEEVIYQWLHQR
jgi:hypothetical protein